MEVQEVELAVSISGDYAAWHELSISFEYDFTNDIELGSSKEEAEALLERGHDVDYSDCEMKSGILYNGCYYISQY